MYPPKKAIVATTRLHTTHHVINDANNKQLVSRAVRIKLFTARVLYRVSYRLLQYSMDTGSSY